MKKLKFAIIIVLTFAMPVLAIATSGIRQTPKPVVHKKRAHRLKPAVVNHRNRMDKQLAEAEYHEPRVERAEAAQRKAKKEKHKLKGTH